MVKEFIGGCAICRTFAILCSTGMVIKKPSLELVASSILDFSILRVSITRPMGANVEDVRNDMAEIERENTRGVGSDFI